MERDLYAGRRTHGLSGIDGLLKRRVAIAAVIL
jgi:hypothetical protein